KTPKFQKRYILIAGAILLICFAGVIIQISIKLSNSKKIIGLVPPNPEVPLPASGSVEHRFTTAAVCSDGPPCAEIGRNTFLKNGSVVDAAIATLFCNGLVNSQSMGLGGGFLMTLYLREEQKAITLDARETAPLKAYRDMYNATEGLSQAAVGVPGELKGYWEAHQRYGKLPWAELVEPTIKLCEEGYVMNKHQYDSIGFRPDFVKKDPILKPKRICKTYKIIAEEGGNVLYNGSLAKLLAEDIKDMGGIITQDDLAQYRVRWVDPITVNLRDKLKLFTIPPPGSGILLAFILNILDGYNFTSESIKDINSTILTYHRMIEAFKFAYARRPEIGDPDYINIKDLIDNLQSRKYAHDIFTRINDYKTSSDPGYYGTVNYTRDDHGTAHVSIIAPNGDAASITSSVNIYFGAGITSQQTGIILNSGMDDFSIPGLNSYFGIPYSSNNAIEPGKRALSSMCPSVIVDENGDVRLVIGASGGTKITTAVAYVIMRHFWFKESVKQAVDASRIHHQIFPMEVSYEYGILDQVVKGLEKIGHETYRYRGRGSIICALAKLGNIIFANADYRKGGDVFGI
ncbi:hypothetical protein L9F63_025212, partial [Diploptera punctata]